MANLPPPLDRVVLELLAARAPGATICPSEVARRAGGAQWRDLMEPVRRAARQLAAEGVVEVTQHGQVVDPAAARGPIRLRLPLSLDLPSHGHATTGPATPGPATPGPATPGAG